MVENNKKWSNLLSAALIGAVGGLILGGIAHYLGIDGKYADLIIYALIGVCAAVLPQALHKQS